MINFTLGAKVEMMIFRNQQINNKMDTPCNHSNHECVIIIKWTLDVTIVTMSV